MFPIHTSVPSRYSPFMTWALIAANSVVFFFESHLGARELNAFLFQYALVPAHYFGSDLAGHVGLPSTGYWPFVTNIFLHGGWLHLIVNMWTLWLFGPAVEDRLGIVRYASFFLVCGLLASLAQAAFTPNSKVPILGASGAIAGVLGCYVRLFPRARVLILVPVLFLPFFFEVGAVFFIGLWFLLQLLQGTAELFVASSGGGVAWWAHVGGFVGGFLLTPLLRRPPPRYRDYYGDEGIFGFHPRGHR